MVVNDKENNGLSNLDTEGNPTLSYAEKPNKNYITSGIEMGLIL